MAIQDVESGAVRKPHQQRGSSIVTPCVIASFVFTTILLAGWPIVSIPAGHVAVVDFFGHASQRTLQSGIQFKTLFARTHSFSLKTQVRCRHTWHHAWYLHHAWHHACL